MHPSKLLRNLFYASITNFSDLLVVVVMIFAARKLGDENFGMLSYAQALAIIFLTPMNFGLGQIIVRNVSRHKELASKYFFNAVWWRTLLAIISILTLSAVIFFAKDYSRHTQLTIIIITFAMALRFSSFNLRLFFRPLDLFNCEAIANFIEQMLYMLFGLTVLLMGKGLIWLASAFLMARLIGCCISFYWLNHHVPFRPEPDVRLIVQLQKTAIPVGISFLFTNVYLHVDTLILSELSGFGAVGAYNAALKIYMTSMMLAAIVSNVFLPQLSKSFSGTSKQLHNRLILYGIGGMLAVSTPVWILGALGAPWFIPYVFGADFVAAVKPIQILVFVTIPAFQLVFAKTLLVAANHQKAMMWISLIGLIARVTFDLVLIPWFGITGAAIAAGISEITMLVVVWVYMVIHIFRIRSLADIRSRLAQTQMS